VTRAVERPGNASIAPALATPAPAAVAAGPLAPPRTPVAQWSRRFAARLVLSDALCMSVAILIGWIVLAGGLHIERSAVLDYLFWSGALTLGWLICVQAVDGYEVRRLSTGAREYQRVLRAGMNMAGGVAIAGYLTRIGIARTFLAVVIPTGALLMVLARYAGRKFVHRLRLRGEWTSSILAVGTSESVRHLAQVASRNPAAGLVVVGACVEDVAVGEELTSGVPVVGDVAHVADAAARLGVDVVAVAGAGLGPRRIRELGWALEGTGCALVMAPGLTEVAGPRVHVSPVEGLPLMWVDQPQFTGLRRVVKRAVDVVGAAVLLAVAAPVLLLIALAVRLTSRGPALYVAARTGQDGRPIRVYKFRSMYADADARRADLLVHNESDGGMLFKLRRDPRVTPVGRLIRKFSLDELPQLGNVLGGSMSLVGPRPPLPDEVERYNPHVHRRLLVKPGMTGLWQVSGRSDLSWDETVRLDLYYVENWSLTLDLAIIARTVWAVIRSRGAY
jgi:exopolysaccharide biosynthesis polyprenyl glycosylphosphotransferase